MSASPITVVEPPKGLAIDVSETWRYRELLYFLVWRDVKVRYKQTALGIAWAVLQPLVATLIFTVIFGRFVKVPTGGVPYAAFAICALVPWTYFTQSVGTGGTSLLANRSLVTKIYFPRVLIPAASVGAPLVDMIFSGTIAVGLLAWYRIVPGWEILALPAFVLAAVVAALGVVLVLSALTVRYRDVPFVIPFLLQVWMYATPVVYGLSVVPEQWRWLFALNPMTAVVEGFRWSLLGDVPLDGSVTAISVLSGVVLLVVGAVQFSRVERSFADVI